MGTHRMVGAILSTGLLVTACTGQVQPTTSATTAAAASPTPPSGTTQASRSAITITLTNSDCTAEGIGNALPQQFAAAVSNSSTTTAVVNLQRLNDGHTFAELESWIQARQRAIAAGSDIDAMPPMTTIVVRVKTDAGGREGLEGKLTAGTYGLVCRRPADGTAQAIHLRGPFRVD